MALAIDSATEVNASGTTTATRAHVCSGTNRVIVTMVTAWDAANDTHSVVTGVTYAGTAMTKITDVLYTGLHMTASAWYLINPAAGTNNVVVSMTGSTDSIGGETVSFTGASQVSQPNVFMSGTATTGTTRNDTFTTTVDGCYRCDVCQTYDYVINGVGAGQTTVFTSGGGYIKATYSGPITPAGSDTDSFTTATNSRWISAGIAIAPVPVGGTVIPPRRMLLGVGV